MSSKIKEDEELDIEKSDIAQNDTELCAFADITKPDVPQNEKESMMALLPPDHPLLGQFQANLRDFLIRSREQLQEQIDDIKYRIKLKEHEREEEGAKLYDRQQEMAYQNEQIGDLTNKIAENVEKRLQEEAAVQELKEDFDGKVGLIKDHKTIYNKRMMDLEQLNTLENKIRQWASELDDEVKNAKRTVNRDTQIQQKISEEKKKSDILFYHLSLEIRKNDTELKNINNEIANMNEKISILNQSLTSANTDLEVLQTEHKNLHQAWNDVIIAISHRDKLLYQLNVDITKHKENIKLSSSSIEAIKKQISKELVQNEKLKTFKIRLQNDFNSLKRDCQKQSKTLSELELKLEEIPMWLAQTEKDMHEARREGNALLNDIRKLQWKLDKKNSKKYEIEELILKLAQEQLVTDKASEYRHKLLNKARNTRRQMDLLLAQTQNQLSERLLDLEKNKNIIFQSRQDNTKLRKKLNDVELKYDQLNTELTSLENQIDLKLKRIDKLNSELDQKKHAKEITATSPIDMKISVLEKTIQDAEQQIREHQRFWLMLQNHYVNLTHKRNAQLNEIQVAQKQFSIIKQKSLKIDHELELSEQKTSTLLREITVYTSKIELLNAKMSKKQHRHEAEEQSCELEHAELLDRLKKNEMDVLKLEEDINEVQNDIDHLKDLVLDKHREVLSWETKYKLIEETLRWRKDEAAMDSEMNTMKTEIHRMQIRHNQLKRAQEKLIIDFNHCVMHREQIFIAVSNREFIENNPFKSKANVSLRQKILDLRNKIKQINEEIVYITEHRLVENSTDYECVHKEIKALSERIDQEIEQCELLRVDIEQCVLLKYINLENIVRKQTRAKAYQKLTANIGTIKSSRSETSINSMMEKQLDINHNLMDILQNLIIQYPEQKTFFSKILQLLKEK